MKARWRLAGLLLALLPLAEAAADSDTFVGVWQGEVVEIPLPGQDISRYVVTIDIVPGSVTVAYPGLGCGGALHPLRRRGRLMGFRDALDYGLDRCEANGRTELYLLDAGLVDYRWFDARGRLRAAGRLLRDEKLRIVSAEQWETARRN